MRSATLVLLSLLLGCGRVGFDDDPPFTLRQADGALRIEAPGRYRVELADTSHWQVRSWVDLSVDRGTELAGRADGGSLEYNLVQAPYRVWYGGELSLDDVGASGYRFLVIAADRVVIETWYEWFPTADDAIEVIAEHELLTDGTWNVTATLYNKDGGPKTLGFAYAFTNVAATLPWSETRRADGFSLTLPSGSALEVRRGESADASVASDRFGNVYFDAASEITLAASGTVAQSWTNQLGRY